MIKFGNCSFCSKDGLIIPLERCEKTLVCCCCKSNY